VGMVKAEGRTLGEVEDEINRLAKSKYSNMKVKLQIPAGNGFSVFVYGEVNKPGKVYVANNSSVMDALNAAGGVKKSGTLRNIKYNNKYVDLYNFLFLGNDNNIIVKANDKIFVDKIKNTMSFKNGVKAPGIYEFKTGETIGDMMKYAGDLMVTTQRNDVVVESFDKSSKQKMAQNIEYMKAKTPKLSDGDAIQFQEMYNDVENIVTLQGNIKHPATFAYKDGMRLSDIIKDEDELMEESFIYQAVIRRVSGENHEVQTIPVYLKDFFAGTNDPILLPRDTVTVYKNTNRAFVDVYGCINLPKHIPYTTGMKLSDVMADIQFMESTVVPETEVEEEVTEEVKTKDGEQIIAEGDFVKIKTTTENVNKLIPTENIAVEITDKDGKRTRMFYLYDIMMNSDAIKTISLYPEEKIFFRTLRNNEIIKKVRITKLTVCETI
jgi:protein involved in polysaccharide export with SLBB domain